MKSAKGDSAAWVDLHTHILPGIDDGAKDEATSLRMLQLQQREGVDRLFLTPHYDCRRQSVDDFLRQRQEAYDRLCRAAAGTPVPAMKLGAEVHFSADLMEQDLSRLTLGESDYLLLELSHRRYPPVLVQAIEQMLDCGITPILAHVERFSYFAEHLDLLLDLIYRGVLAQVSADVFISRRCGSFARACLKHDLAQFVASDAHNDTERLPCLGQAMARLPDTLRTRANAFADAVWEGRDALAPTPRSFNTLFCRRP